MQRIWLIWAGFHGFVSVAMGAFAAHLFRARLSPEMLEIMGTGARYQMFSALALLGLASVSDRLDVKASGWCLAYGAFIFSGSLYALALSGEKMLGAVTPFGGALLLAGWARIAWLSGRSPSI